tara:strand:- start:1438 stop:1860 length:423 start_codon:yes stop_codon:yes gene_type:complete
MNVTVENPWLGTQISFWKGQKREVYFAPTGEAYPFYRGFILNKYRPFSFIAVWIYRTRTSLGMRGRSVAGSTREVLTKTYINPKNAPPRKTWLQSIRIRFINDVKRVVNLGTSLAIRKFKFYKAQSLLKLRKKYEIESYY